MLSASIFGDVSFVPLFQLPVVVLGLILLYSIIRTRYFHPLSKIPGPVLASVSKLWQYQQSISGKEHTILSSLHDKYGPIYRAAPNRVLVNDSAFAHQIYSWERAIFSQPLEEAWGGVFIASEEGSNKAHDEIKKCLTPAYSLAAILKNESAMDSIVLELVDVLRTRYANVGRTCDLAKYLESFPMDFITTMAFSHSFDYIRHGEKLAPLLEGIKRASAISSIPVTWPSFMVALNSLGIGPALARISAKGVIADLRKTASDVVDSRLQDHGLGLSHKDLVQGFLDYRDLHNKGIPHERVKSELWGAYLVGSNSTSTTLTMVILLVITNPVVYNRLLEEIDAAEKAHLLSNPVQYNEVKQHVPYLSAILKEAVRLRPPIPFVMPRIVPSGGVRICGHYLPEGTEIGCLTYSINRQTSIYGSDAAMFRPERWLEGEEQVKRFEKVELGWGASRRLCLGKNLAIVEMSKALTELFRQFEMRIETPEKPMEIYAMNGFWISDFNVGLKSRHSAEKTGL